MKTTPVPPALDITVDRSARQPLAEQIFTTLRAGILNGTIEPGARLPSWRDLAVQLGIARGTVRAAYERLADEMLVISAGAAGTRVAAAPADVQGRQDDIAVGPPLLGLTPEFSMAPLPFQMGVPAQDAFPAKTWARLHARAAREIGPASYADPRGLPELRTQIAAYLAMARGITCVPDQVMVTAGYRGALGLAIHAVSAEGKRAWMEEPGYPIARLGLEMAGMRPVPVPVDADGMDVAQGLALAPDAVLAVVTPGQQAPTGVALSSSRRQALLRWATEADAWVIEDDYLSELQLKGRARPALAAADPTGRVIHIGTFSKTLSPSLGLGFLVAPRSLAKYLAEVAACLSPAPNLTIQRTLAAFLADGHYLRHLRHMKRLYGERRDALRRCLGGETGAETMSGLAVMLQLPPHFDDMVIAEQALAVGLAPAPLSPWYIDPDRRAPGLLLGVTNLRDRQIADSCEKLTSLLRACLV